MTEEKLKEISQKEAKKLSNYDFSRWAALKGLDDLFYFDRNILGYKDMTENTHRELINFITNPNRKNNKLILLPRGTFKSSAVTQGYSLQKIVKDPNIRILIGSMGFTRSAKLCIIVCQKRYTFYNISN